jgi:hypothetical protein
MDSRKFDALTRALGSSISRRAAVHAAAALAIATAIPVGDAAAATCARATAKCTRGAECCSGSCKKRKNARKGTCRPSGDGGRCRTDDDCKGNAPFCDRRCLDADCARCATTDQPVGFCKDDIYC